MDSCERLVAAALAALPTTQPGQPARWRGRIKTVPEDFFVEELPAYEPAGEGDHLFLWIEKRNVPALELAPRLARALGVRPQDVGVAGMKDMRAVTRQYVSVPKEAEARVGSAAVADLSGIKVLSQARHGNKLKTGHLRGNRFTLIVRDVETDAPGEREQALGALIDGLNRVGLVNAFGGQRFGRADSTLRLGCRLLGMGGSEPGEPASPSRPGANGRLRRLALSSVQSALFNLFVAERLRAGTLHSLAQGDVAVVVRSGGPFLVDDVADAARRCEGRDIVLGGPLFGPKMLAAHGDSHAHELAILRRFDLTPSNFGGFGKLLPGGRRPAVVWPTELKARLKARQDAESKGDQVELSFCLPSGSYATQVVAALFAPWAEEPV